MQANIPIAGSEELIILAQLGAGKHYSEHIYAFLDEGVYFPFADDYSLPTTLPKDLTSVRCVMLDEERHAELRATIPDVLCRFEQGGGYLYIPNRSVPVGGGIGYAGAAHCVQRAICTCGLTMKHPAMLARLSSQSEEDMVAHWKCAASDELSQYEAMANYFCDPIGFITFRACDEAADFFQDRLLQSPVDAYIGKHFQQFGNGRESTGARYLFKYSQRSGNSEVHSHLLDKLAKPRLWCLNGVYVNRDLVVPEGMDPDNPPARVVDNAWTWPENAAALGDTFGYVSLLTGDASWNDRAVSHILKVFDWLYDSERKLIIHVGRPDGPDRRSVPWGRGVAWYLYAIRGLLDDLPDDHAARPELCRILQVLFSGLLEYQDGYGFWHNVIDADPEDSRPCASATSRFLHVFARAYSKGWLEDDRVPGMVELAWQGLKTKLWNYGLVAYCVGTSYGLSRQVYLARPHHTFRCSRSEMLLNWIERKRMRKTLGIE